MLWPKSIFTICLLLLFGHSFGQGKKLFLVAGQSNAVGVGKADSSLAFLNPLCFEYYSEPSSLKLLQDPVGYTLVNEDFQAALSGSAWPAFADTYQQLNGDSVIIIQAAKGGTACHEKADGGAGNWSNNYHLFQQAVAKTKKAESFTGRQVDGIIWLQGESDAIGILQDKITACQYKWALQNLIQRFRNELHCNLPFYIIQTGLYLPEYDTAFNLVRDVQQQVADEDPLTFIVDSSANQYRALGYMTDQIHFDQRALNAMGTNAAQTIRQLELSVNMDSCFTLPAAPLSPDWAVYPSPFTDKLTIEVRNFSCGNLEVELTNALGKKMQSSNYDCFNSSPIKFDVNTAALSPGVYIVHLRLNKQWELKQKLVKE